jgi:hypothetical protein
MSNVETVVPAPPHFGEFPKIARLNREVVVTEKIDGTNAQVYLKPKLEPGYAERVGLIGWVAENDAFWMFAGSRNRYITPEKDNFGFARWAKEHAEELFALGQGTHYGEWWGAGVQRGYGLVNGEKRFSLFNVGRWYDEYGTNAAYAHDEKARVAPACCRVVPILSVLPNLDHVNAVLEALRQSGSAAAPGFMKPEGVVAFHSASGSLYKATCEKDEKPKGQVA